MNSSTFLGTTAKLKLGSTAWLAMEATGVPAAQEVRRVLQAVALERQCVRRSRCSNPYHSLGHSLIPRVTLRVMIRRQTTRSLTPANCLQMLVHDTVISHSPHWRSRATASGTSRSCSVPTRCDTAATEGRQSAISGQPKGTSRDHSVPQRGCRG